MISKLVQFIRDQQRRIIDLLELPNPVFTVWSPEVPDSRVRDEAKRGLISTPWGPGSRMYCARCHKPSPYAAPETMLKTYYVCFPCVQRHGPPRDAIKVPGSELM